MKNLQQTLSSLHSAASHPCSPQGLYYYDNSNIIIDDVLKSITYGMILFIFTFKNHDGKRLLPPPLRQRLYPFEHGHFYITFVCIAPVSTLNFAAALFLCCQ